MEHQSYFKQEPTSKKIPAETIAFVHSRDGDCRAWSRGFATDVRCNGRPHIHHRRLRSQGGTHARDNLMLLCDHHHHLAHRVRREEAEDCGVILRKAPSPLPPLTPDGVLGVVDYEPDG